MKSEELATASEVLRRKMTGTPGSCPTCGYVLKGSSFVRQTVAVCGFQEQFRLQGLEKLFHKYTDRINQMYFSLFLLLQIFLAVVHSAIILYFNFQVSMQCNLSSKLYHWQYKIRPTNASRDKITLIRTPKILVIRTDVLNTT